MKIRTSLPQISEQILFFIAEGFDILGTAFTNRHNIPLSTERHDDWSQRVVNYLSSTFPTSKELGQFLFKPTIGSSYNDMDQKIIDIVNSTDKRIKVLENILDKLNVYYEFQPEQKRLFIQSIDSFSKVRDLNHEQVKNKLSNGFLDISESKIKEAFIGIIGQSYIPKDWGGETEDIYSSMVLLNGERVQTSIILKGTVKSKETHMADLGSNGDQLERMMRSSSSKLFLIQSVKPIGQDIINSAEAFIDQQRSKGNHCYYCTIDGQDTAMLMYAYGFLT